MPAASAPGRVNLLGEHTDYNGGPVLPIAIARRINVSAEPAASWTGLGDSPYLLGVIEELRAIDAAPQAAAVTITSNLPVGVGLSSSAALCVAAAAALSRLAGRKLSKDRIADVAWHAEHDWAGVHCGRMDQTVSALARAGRALHFETGSGALAHVPFVGNICVVETGIARQLAGGNLNRRRRECEEALARLRQRWPGLSTLAALDPAELNAAEPLLPPPLHCRVRHVVTETARTRDAVLALGRTDHARLGALLSEGHTSLARDYESSIPEADFIVEAAVAAGAHGARLTGAGWGGAVIILAPPAEERRILHQVANGFRAAFGRKPAAWRSRAVSGVRVYSPQ